MFIWPKILVQRQECVDLYIEVGGRSRWLAEYQWLGVGQPFDSRFSTDVEKCWYWALYPFPRQNGSRLNSQVPYLESQLRWKERELSESRPWSRTRQPGERFKDELPPGRADIPGKMVFQQYSARRLISAPIMRLEVASGMSQGILRSSDVGVAEYAAGMPEQKYSRANRPRKFDRHLNNDYSTTTTHFTIK